MAKRRQPRLSPRFSRLHPGIDVRVVAANDKPDLEREQLALAIRFVPRGADTPEGERFTDCEIFPVCAPGLARDRTRPLRSPADLAQHARLDFETIRDGWPWSEWDVWYGALRIPAVAPASTLRFSHYDQVIPAAIEGSGVAMGWRTTSATASCALPSAPRARPRSGRSSSSSGRTSLPAMRRRRSSHG